ncbi:hypothetical protein NCAS_0D01730 [Naumovozyma castellii]|uniref:choline-phosphate cytidylyltransferase n=1 Tax=Naumovozyma castellii TaxID=27288 RepID=G0VDW4_NAUCA|nr:hypothetical protein NCAS_0D01730 [Naumovozyma castellii CBS 4309]CCC69754.1 hypothetical protein NCAS_0D01730 [Naumovozyma castellii CBS 4309]
MAKTSRTSSLKKRLSNTSLTNLFKKNKKRKHDDEEEALTVIDASNSPELPLIANKKRRLSVKEEEHENEEEQEEEHKRKEKEKQEFEKREREIDAQLPEELRKYRPKGFPFNLPPKDRPIRIYADGVFDLFHLGHMKQLEQCKKALPNVTLICGIPSDEVTHKLKGLTVLTDKQRCETLRHCRWVDEVIADAPWCVTPEFLDLHHIDYVAHDDIPYTSADSDDIYKPVKEMGKFLVTQRTNGISTSDIITKIIRDYDKYLMRNFARGATRQELNVSWLKKNELEFKKHIKDFRSYFKKNQETLNSSSRDLYFEVREILLKRTLGNKLYMKLVGNRDNLDDIVNESVKKLASKSKRRLLREKSPPSEFASEFTGENIQDEDHEDQEDDDDDNYYESNDGNENENDSDQSDPEPSGKSNPI